MAMSLQSDCYRWPPGPISRSTVRTITWTWLVTTFVFGLYRGVRGVGVFVKLWLDGPWAYAYAVYAQTKPATSEGAKHGGK